MRGNAPAETAADENIRASLMEFAKEKGYAIAIGHVGAEGGENTAKAIIDTLPKIKTNCTEFQDYIAGKSGV